MEPKSSNPPLQWRRNERHGVSNQLRPLCLFNCWFRRRSKKTSKLRVTGLCEGNSAVTGEFPHKRSVKQKMFSFDDVTMRGLWCQFPDLFLIEYMECTKAMAIINVPHILVPNSLYDHLKHHYMVYGSLLDEFMHNVYIRRYGSAILVILLSIYLKRLVWQHDTSTVVLSSHKL